MKRQYEQVSFTEEGNFTKINFTFENRKYELLFNNDTKNYYIYHENKEDEKTCDKCKNRKGILRFCRKLQWHSIEIFEELKQHPAVRMYWLFKKDA